MSKNPERLNGVVVNSPKKRRVMEATVNEEKTIDESVDVKVITKEEKDEENDRIQQVNQEPCMYEHLMNVGSMNKPNPYDDFYDQVRANNLAEKASMLKFLQLDKFKEELKVSEEAIERKKAKESKPRRKAAAVKSSPYAIRERKNQPNYSDKNVPMKDTTAPLRRISPRIMKREVKSLSEESLANETVNAEELKIRRDGPLNMVDVFKETTNGEDWEEHMKVLGRYLAHKKKGEEEVVFKGKSWTSAIDVYKTAKQYWKKPSTSSENLDGFKAKVSKLKMFCGSMTKVVRERIASIAVHPSKDCLIVAAGGKNGTLGIWVASPVLSRDIGDIKKETGSDLDPGVYMFEPHDGMINCATFCHFGGDRLITTSYDGTVRSLNLEKLVFDQLYASPVYLSKNWMQWHCQMSPNVILASQGTGNVYVLDDRSHHEQEAVLNCYERSCRTVSIHPLYPQYMATSSSCGYTSIWDLRKFKSKGNKKNDSSAGLKGVVNCEAAICHLGAERRFFSSSFFSPITGSGLLTTSSDDYIRVYDTSRLVEGVPNSSLYRVETGIKHNNRTGRWLTTFKATWHPQRDDAFVVGSMAQPRQIEVFGRHGRLLTLIGKDGPLPINTVCPVNAFHPYRLVLASGDTGGRVHLFL